MRFGKIRIENKEVQFHRRMKFCQVPCRDVLWVYQYRPMGEDSSNDSLCILTRKGKYYRFDMSVEEARSCILYLKEENPEILTGSPKGAEVPLNDSFNIRDLGGFRSNGEKYILPHRLLRSGDLYHLSLEDQTLLADEYHLGTVIDFRTELEYARRPDVEMKGVDYVSLPVWGGNALWENREITLEYVLKHVQKNPESFMMNMYQKLILDKECQHQYALFFQCLMDCEEGKAVLWHSSFGKDRAAIASMLLLYALEVPRGEIFDDYMLSNRALEKDQKYLERLLKSRGEDWEKVERLLVLMSAQECYLQTAMNTIQAEYGSMERYLRKAVCLTARSLKILRGKYLV